MKIAVSGQFTPKPNVSQFAPNSSRFATQKNPDEIVHRGHPYGSKSNVQPLSEGRRKNAEGRNKSRTSAWSVARIQSARKKEECRRKKEEIKTKSTQFLSPALRLFANGGLLRESEVRMQKEEDKMKK